MLARMNLVDNYTNHASLVSSEIADRTRETPRQFWDPGRKLLLSIRRYQYWHQRRGIIAGVICKVWSCGIAFGVVRGADIPLNCQIGGDLLIPHSERHCYSPGRQDWGKLSDISAGYHRQPKCIGPSRNWRPRGHRGRRQNIRWVNIGSHARIGANAVVVKDGTVSAVAAGVSN